MKIPEDWRISVWNLLGICIIIFPYQDKKKEINKIKCNFERLSENLIDKRISQMDLEYKKKVKIKLIMGTRKCYFLPNMATHSIIRPRNIISSIFPTRMQLSIQGKTHTYRKM